MNLGNDTQRPRHRLATLLGAALFVATSLSVTPAADAAICEGDTMYCVELVKNLVCNPINPTAAPPEPGAEPSQPEGPRDAVPECKNVDDLVARVYAEAAWALDYAGVWVAWAENLAEHPCGSQQCLQSCGGGQTGEVVDGVRVCLDYTGLCSPGYGVWVDGIPLCVTVGLCGGSGYGVVVDGTPYCVTLGRTGPCTNGGTGYEVDGQALCFLPCPDGQAGVNWICVPTGDLSGVVSTVGGLPGGVLGRVGNGGQPDTSEYVHAGYSVPQVFGGQAVRSDISVGGECNRPDLHAISSWISLMTYDNDGNPAWWWQTGYDQPWQTSVDRCSQAIPFYQGKDEAADAYTKIHYATPESAPANGEFTLVFGTIDQNPTVAAAPAARESCTTRVLVGKTCPLVINRPEADSCPALGPWNGTCATRRAMLADFAQTAPSCPAFPALLETMRDVSACQAAEATRAILNGTAIPTCDEPGALEGWVCMMPDEPLPNVIDAADQCFMGVLYNGHPLEAGGSPVVGPSGCYSGGSEATYELAQDVPGDALSEPGDLDVPSEFDQWSGMTDYGWQAVDANQVQPYWDFAGTCDEYQLKIHWIDQFLGPGTLVIHNWEGPNIPPKLDGTPYCGQADSDSH